MGIATRTQSDTTPGPGAQWHAVIDAEGRARPVFERLLRDMSQLAPGDLRHLGDRMDATLREMGVTFDLIRDSPWGRQPWTCDLLPHVFSHEDWETIVRGFRQRTRAFEMFLDDVYGTREILRAGILPIQVVLGSPHFQHAAVGLPRPRHSFLHLCGMGICRGEDGTWQVKDHYFGHATGISFMMQNRRALARVVPEIFQDTPVQPLAEVPLAIMERLRETATGFGSEPTVVLLAPDNFGGVSTKQSFLARRMGIPLVAAGDLLVLEDRVYLKTVRGLDRVEVIYNRVPDSWLDPLVFRSDSHLGVPGLIQCVRRGTVALVNGVGSQLADDRSLLAFAGPIIRYYLAETPILPGVETRWLGDIDQREMVLDNIAAYRISRTTRIDATDAWDRALDTGDESLRTEIRRRASAFVAQPLHEGAMTLCYKRGARVEHPQDHIVFGVRTGDRFDVFPGALTRVFSGEKSTEQFGLSWTSKDSWVLSAPQTEALLPPLVRRNAIAGLPPRQVTSRVAESFYWLGRYLERAQHQAYLISVIETLETEELNSAERQHYRPMWNRLLPPLEKANKSSRRSITTRRDRYRLVLSPEPGSLVTTFMRAVRNAESVQDTLSPEAWATLSNLRGRFEKTRFREDAPEHEAARATRRLADIAIQLIPQFFAVCDNTMLADDGWRFCEIGRMLERATLTANAICAISESFTAEDPAAEGDLSRRTSIAQAVEIELSAFLRLLGCRDAYRRIFQMRAEPAAVLELLWQHPEVPRSVRHCLRRCARLLRESIDPEMMSSAPDAIEDLSREIKQIDWSAFVRPPEDEERAGEPEPATVAPRTEEFEPLLARLFDRTLEIHTHIADSFLNHQALIVRVTKPEVSGF